MFLVSLFNLYVLCGSKNIYYLESSEMEGNNRMIEMLKGNLKVIAGPPQEFPVGPLLTCRYTKGVPQGLITKDFISICMKEQRSISSSIVFISIIVGW